MEKWKQEVRQAEEAFAKMAREVTIADAFLAFADKNAVLVRNENLVKGHDEIREYFKNPFWEKDMTLEWKPDHIDVSSSGDLGYTYGKYRMEIEENGETEVHEGIFRTVWKRQKDGTWKYVLD